MNNYDNTNKGAVWLRTSQKGMKYMSGTLNVNGVEYDIAMFKNDKKSDKAPDYRLTLTAKDKTNDADKVYIDFGNLVEENPIDDDSLPFWLQKKKIRSWLNASRYI